MEKKKQSYNDWKERRNENKRIVIVSIPKREKKYWLFGRDDEVT